MSVYTVVVKVIDETGAEIVGAAREVESEALQAWEGLEGHAKSMFEHVASWFRGEQG